MRALLAGPRGGRREGGAQLLRQVHDPAAERVRHSRLHTSNARALARAAARLLTSIGALVLSLR